MKTALKILGYCVLALAASLLYPYTVKVSGILAGAFAFLLITEIVVHKYGERSISSLVSRETVLKLGISPIIAFAVCALWMVFASSFLSSLLATVLVGFSFMGLSLAIVARNSANNADEN